MEYNEKEIKTMQKLDSLYMAAIRAHLVYQTDFTRGQVSGVELAYMALNLEPVGFAWVHVDEIFREE